MGSAVVCKGCLQGVSVSSNRGLNLPLLVFSPRFVFGICVWDGVSRLTFSSLLLLIDGYNVLAPIAPPGRGAESGWLQHERSRLIERLLRGLPEEIRTRSCVVFDAADPPPDRPSEYTVDGLLVRFAVEYPEADDLLEWMIAANSAPKNLAVVSSDHRVQAAAKRRDCKVYESQQWLDDLLDGVIGLAGGARRWTGEGRGVPPVADDSESVEESEVKHWLREFGF